MRRLGLAIVMAGAMLATSASAAVLNWTFEGVTFDDGGTLSGSLQYDNTSELLVDWDFTTTAGSLQPGFHFDSSNSTLFGAGVFGFPNSFTITRDSPYAEPYMQLSFVSSLAVAGTIALSTDAGLSGSWECSNCSNQRYVTGGGITTGAVPEPGTWALMILGFGASGAALRRRKLVAA